MRSRDQILDDLESGYREAFGRAEAAGDGDAMAQLDFDFQRDQLWFEVVLDVRDLLGTPPESPAEEKGLLDRAKALRNLAKGRLP